MQITDVKVRKVESENRMKAIASVTFDNAFVVHDIKVIVPTDKPTFIASKPNQFRNKKND